MPTTGIPWKQEAGVYQAQLGVVNLMVSWSTVKQTYHSFVNGTQLKQDYVDLAVAKTYCLTLAAERCFRTYQRLMEIVHTQLQLGEPPDGPDLLGT